MSTLEDLERRRRKPGPLRTEDATRIEQDTDMGGLVTSPIASSRKHF